MGLEVVLGALWEFPFLQGLDTEFQAQAEEQSMEQVTPRILTGDCAVGSAVTVNANPCQVTGVPREGLHWRPLLVAAEFDAAR